MKTALMVLMSALFTLIFTPAAFAKEDPAAIAAAKEFFTKYTRLGNSFDPALADLYADNADIQNTRYFPNGSTKTLRMPAPEYKRLIVASMPLAKAKNDRDTYSKTTYTVSEDGAVRIQALRHSELKNYDSWLVLQIRKGPNGWKIVQELSQSRP